MFMLLVENDNFIDYWYTNDIVDCGYITVVTEVEDHKIDYQEKLIVSNTQKHFSQEKLNIKKNHNHTLSFNNGESNSRNKTINTTDRIIQVPRNNNKLSSNKSNKPKDKTTRVNHSSKDDTNRYISDTSYSYKYKKIYSEKFNYFSDFN